MAEKRQFWWCVFLFMPLIKIVFRISKSPLLALSLVGFLLYMRHVLCDDSVHI